jgi:hypothetical protein
MFMAISHASLLLMGLLSVLQTNPAVAGQSLFKVSGRVIGNKTSSVVLRGPAGEHRATVRADGSFEIAGVPPGNYAANAEPPNPFGRAELARVQSADIRDVAIQNPVIHRVAGRIASPGGVPIPELSLSVPPPPLPNLAAPAPNSPMSALSAEIQQILNLEREIPLKPNPDGTFVVNLPEGERRLSVLKKGIPAGFTVDAFTYGSQNLLNNPIRITPGPPSEISIVLKKAN